MKQLIESLVICMLLLIGSMLFVLACSDNDTDVDAGTDITVVDQAADVEPEDAELKKEAAPEDAQGD